MYKLRSIRKPNPCVCISVYRRQLQALTAEVDAGQPDPRDHAQHMQLMCLTACHARLHASHIDKGVLRGVFELHTTAPLLPVYGAAAIAPSSALASLLPASITRLVPRGLVQSAATQLAVRTQQLPAAQAAALPALRLAAAAWATALASLLEHAGCMTDAQRSLCTRQLLHGVHLAGRVWIGV